MSFEDATLSGHGARAHAFRHALGKPPWRCRDCDAPLGNPIHGTDVRRNDADELAWETREYPDMAEAARFMIDWAGSAERALSAVHRGRIPTRCNCDHRTCKGWIMLPQGALQDILAAAEAGS